MQPKQYNSWYDSPYGSWVGKLEFSLLQQIMSLEDNSSLLDIGCGTGYFSRKFANQELNTTALDNDFAMLEFAKSQKNTHHFLLGNALNLPFKNNTYDYCSAITSFCFIDKPYFALQEMWRVSQKGIVLGLLNRHSLLYLQKANKGNYQGARWDSARDVQQWIQFLKPVPVKITFRTAVFIPGLGLISKNMEQVINNRFPLGGFLAVYLQH